MSDIESQPQTDTGSAPDWLDPNNVAAAMVPSDVVKAAIQIEQTTGIGVDPKEAKVVGRGVLPSVVEQNADWPGSDITADTNNVLPPSSGPNWHES